MQDWHIHIERGSYNEEWIRRFVNQAMSRQINKICLLEHSHRFVEFEPIYKSVREFKGNEDYQANWLSKKFEQSINEYMRLIRDMREIEFPIEVRFGLEVCYLPGEEETIKKVLSDFDWDFITGSVHFIDGWGFDHRANLPVWKTVDINEIYIKYYEIMNSLVESGLFTVLAHPDSIKCFNYYSSIDLSESYERLASEFKKKNMKVEFNNGLHINYGHEELGMNKLLLRILLDNEVDIVTSSDAHKPEDVGKYIEEAEKIIKSIKGS